jgi:predicted sulfurtransferase
MVARTKLAFLALSFLLLSTTSLADTKPDAQALAQVQAEAKKGNYQLISPATVRDQFVKEPGSLFLVDTRQGWEYQREHIKGAVNLPATPSWWTQYSPWARSEIKKLLGPEKKRHVVFY